MTLEPLRVVEHLHGHAGWLAAVALLHPAILLRDRARRIHLSVGLATGFVTIVSAVGMWLYVPYRERLKQEIFQRDPFVGFLFERKEHLALGALLLAWAGAAAYYAAWRAAPETRATLRTTAFRAFAGSAAMAIAVAALGTVVAVFKTF